MKKKITSTLTKVIVTLMLGLSMAACKDGDKDAGWFSGGDDLEKITAADLQEGWESIPQTSLEYAEEIDEFYRSNSFAPIWNEEEVRTAFSEELAKAGEDGLSSEAFYTSELRSLLDSSEEITSAERLSLELMLSDTFLKYTHALYYGKVDPNELYSLWGIDRKELDLTGLLQKISQGESVSAAIESLRPQHPVYAGLKQSLQEYGALKEKDTAAVKIAEGKTIKPGDRDARIPQLAKRLEQLGFYQQDSLQTDSVYGGQLQLAIEQFQEDKGLEPDGILGNSTIRELNMDYSALYNKILVNLERWRWYPRDLGDHYILVNIPDFKLAVVKDGDTVRTHNVIAGSKERQTVVFSDTLEYIVLNPEWNIPPTIQKEDIIPKATANPSYLANNNISVSSPGGKVLDPRSIDWSSPEVQNFRFSQSAGPTNPLGRVKIIYPNEYLIYLHDTPSKALFNRADRAESSGCVRVEHAIDLAAYVVESQDPWTLEQIQKQIASGQTKHVKIERPIQVHHLYWTAWRGLEKTYFADDVYDLDEDLYKALTAP